MVVVEVQYRSCVVRMQTADLNTVRRPTLPTCTPITSPHAPSTLPGGAIELSWLGCWVGYPGGRSMNPITAITFSCVATHLSAMYNLQHHQRPLSVIPCLYGVGS